MREDRQHPFLSGNFAPVKRELPLTACRVTYGRVPEELGGGEYVRNGGNTFNVAAVSRLADWFDGDGMLTGVFFQETHKGDIQPHFINRFILTDVLLSASSMRPDVRRPLLPSISTFAASLSLLGFMNVVLQILRTVVLSLLTWLPPWDTITPLRRISTANTSIWWHDGQAYAGCESGPPMKILLPGLETASWWTGESKGRTGWTKTGGGIGPLGMLNEFTTAHPRIDPITNELLLYHMSFVPPYLRISVIPTGDDHQRTPLLGAPVPGVSKPKLAHDFCATKERTILIDMPLTLDPMNFVQGKPMLSYEGPRMPTRFGIMPRRQPEQVRWYESQACCIYHAANAWDEDDFGGKGVSYTNLVACRLNSATLVYAAGNIDTPEHAKAALGDEKCQLYYWQFPHAVSDDTRIDAAVSREFALSEIPFEFPTMDDTKAQRRNTFVYGATMTNGSFDAGLGAQSAKIDCLAKINIEHLIRRGHEAWNEGRLRKGEAVDRRSVKSILQNQRDNQPDDRLRDDIQLFALPPNHYAQEATFVPRTNGQHEDEGFLVFFVFDEGSGLDEHTGHCRSDATSQLWVLDARSMKDVVCRVKLPQRVPYGLHGHFFSRDDIYAQRPVAPEHVRNWALAQAGGHRSGVNLGMSGEKGFACELSYTMQTMLAFKRSIARMLG